MKRLWMAAALIAAMGAGLASAAPRCGAVLCPTDLSVEQLQQVIEIIDEGRSRAPEAFDRLAAVRAALPAADAARHGRYAVIGPALASLGDGALPALVERVVVDDPGPEKLEGTALMAWRMGLVEAIGKQRDQRAAAVLEAVCRHQGAEPELLTTAAGALGKLESDEAAQVLVELSEQRGRRGRAVLAGMGHCRRLAVARRLAEALAEADDHEALRSIARSLATAANGPVWRAGLVKHPAEGPELRQIATRALLASFVEGDDLARRELTTALLVVDDPLALTLIADERASAPPEIVGALDHLAARLASNPVSRMKVAKPPED